MQMNTKISTTTNVRPKVIFQKDIPKDDDGLKLFAGPLGIVSTDKIEKDLDLYTVHTNVVITSALAKAVAKVEGLESFNVLSPYRMKVGIGKLFNASLVCANIREIFYDLPKPFSKSLDELQNHIKLLKESDSEEI